MNIKRINTLIITLLFSFVMVGCSDSDDPAPPVVEESTTIVDAAVSNGNFTTLVTALQATGLDATLADTNATFTVFAPTDEAFALLGEDTINSLLADTDTLSNILTYHVLAGSVDSSTAISSAGNAVETVNGKSVGLSLSDGQLLVNTATVVTTDIIADNGIIHVIDAVLLPPADTTSSGMNIVETAVADGRFSTLVTALQVAGLDSILSDDSGTFTVFAPTDDAFATVGDNLLDAILADADVLQSILLQHVVSGEAVNSVSAYTLNGASAETASTAMIPLMINKDSDMLTFGGANIVIKDIYTSNGIIHVIDTVVVGDVNLPAPLLSITDVAVENGSFNTLVAALQATGLDQVLEDHSSQFTVFAPTDDAFAKLGQDTITSLLNDPETLTEILKYHVIPNTQVLQDAAVSVAQSAQNKVITASGKMMALTYSNSSLYANTSQVVLANVMADNGVIHVVDKVILPPADKVETSSTIVEVAVSNSEFSTLVDALTVANLVDVLADESKKFTVFAPTNAAFNKIPSETLSALLGDTQALTNVLLQHVTEGEIDSVSAYAASGTSVDTVANDDVDVILVDYSKVMVMDTDMVSYNTDTEMLVGGPASSMSGKTLYVFDSDLGSNSSQCVDQCASNWPPALVSDTMAKIPGLSYIMRNDGYKQATFRGRPLYFYAGDTSAGDVTGEGAGGVWWSVKQPKVSLQIQGSKVITKDIYTSNGIIHVIDTVITETLE